MFHRPQFSTNRNRLVTKHDEQLADTAQTEAIKDDEYNVHGVRNFHSLVKRASVSSAFNALRGGGDGDMGDPPRTPGGTDAYSGLVFREKWTDHPDFDGSNAPVAVLGIESAYDIPEHSLASGGKIQRVGNLVVFYGTLTGTADIPIPHGFVPIAGPVKVGGSAGAEVVVNGDGTAKVTHGAGEAEVTTWVTRDYLTWAQYDAIT
jgi:hypothetical protein